MFSRIALFGDEVGLPMWVGLLDPKRIAAVVVASIRPRPVSVAEFEARGVKILTQPRQSSDDYATFVKSLACRRPDLILCNSYSMKLGPDLLGLVQGNAINAHAALLPRNRGPNPIQWAIIRGDRVTGATLHYMTDEIDAGDIVAQTSVVIDDADTWVSVRDKVNSATRVLVAAELPAILAGRNHRVPQDNAKATVNSRLTPESPRIDFSRMSDEEVYNLVRAQVHPLAGAYLDNPRGERRRFADHLTRSDVARLRLAVQENDKR